MTDNNSLPSPGTAIDPILQQQTHIAKAQLIVPHQGVRLEDFSSSIGVYHTPRLDKSAPHGNQDSPCYISGGRLGDFIHQLSVIHQHYLKTGQPAELYISNTVGDKFRSGIDKTYHETYDIIMAQPYIKSYNIEPEQQNAEGLKNAINLSTWRSHPILHANNWHTIFSTVYGIDWGTKPWITWPHTDPSWHGKTVINTTRRRFPFGLKYPDNAIFICFSQNEYDYFINQNMPRQNTIPCHIMANLSELLTILKSCQRFIGSFSAPFAFANAMNIPTYGFLDSEPNLYNKLDTIIGGLEFQGLKG
jgi:hypothetical protein